MVLFPRKIVRVLENWADTKSRKPLILRGARQVGKTTAIDIFGRQFDQYLKLNLDKREDAAVFERGLSVHETMQAIRLHLNKPSVKDRTLLFLDEIQNSPGAIQAMRYFHEETDANLFVIGAGSLLETLIARDNISFPVGRVEYRFMWPLTFAEFLKATGKEQALDYLNDMSVPDVAHDALQKEYRTYMFVGGMPEIVGEYARTAEVPSLARIYQSLFLSFQDDVEKYAPGRTTAQVIRHAIQSVPFEAGKRIRFHGFGNSNYGSREMGEALRTLEKAMLLKLIYPTTQTRLPLAPNQKRAPRLQFLDTGLMCYSVGLQGRLFEPMEIESVYNGVLAEHVVGQELLAGSQTGSAPVFWVREKKQSNAEIDFLMQHQGRVVPVEVKSGKPGSLRSLQAFVDESGVDLAVRLYSGHLHVQEAVTSKGNTYQLHNLPIYMASRIGNYLTTLDM